MRSLSGLLLFFTGMFIDEAKINVKAGTGGNGCISFHREKFVPKGGPDGGNGGRGGSIYLKADRNYYTLLDFSHKIHFKAKSGAHGQGDNKQGREAEDLFILVPCGTVVYDVGTGELMGELVEDGQTLLVARGGRGGRGNASYATPANRVPRMAEKGEPGEDRWIKLELKLLADVGIVGYPNAGKSTLLSKVSAATPKIAPYPFTTIEPNLGVVSLGDNRRAVFADIPGLIEGAHKGAGMGDKFLRHIERTRLLIHLVDVSQIGPENPLREYENLNKELKNFSPSLAEKPQIVAANKIDIEGTKEKFEALRSAFKEKKIKVYPLSLQEEKGVPQILKAVAKALPGAEAPTSTRVPVLRLPEEETFSITREGHKFIVKGKAVERAVAMTHFISEEGVARLQKKLIKMGVEEALKKEGAVTGDTIKIGKIEFNFQE